MKTRNGFTLIEMLMVMTITALLLTLALPRYFGSVDMSKRVVLSENLKTLRLTIDQFYADKGRYPSSLSELVESKYLRSVPVDPLTESSKTWLLIPPEGDQAGVYDVKSGFAGFSENIQ